jgi:hypothetical protein
MHHQKNTARLLIGERLRAALGLGSDQIFESVMVFLWHF